MRPRRVFVVDDHAPTGERICELCRQAGLWAEFFSRGVPLLRAAMQDPPHLVLCDVMGADFDGFRLCRSLKSHPRTRPIPVVLMSGLRRRADLEQAAEAGACGY